MRDNPRHEGRMFVPNVRLGGLVARQQGEYQ
jgi:hypothetical protein